LLFLSISPDARHSLVIIGWIPIGIEHDQAIGTDQVEAAPASLGGQHENECPIAGVIELIDDFAALLDGHGAVQADILVASHLAQLREHVKSLGVVGDQDYFVGCVGFYCQEQIVEHCHFPGQFTLNLLKSLILKSVPFSPRHMYPIKPKGLSLGLGFLFLSIRVLGLGLGISQIFCKFRTRLFKIKKFFLIFGYGLEYKFKKILKKSKLIVKSIPKN